MWREICEREGREKRYVRRREEKIEYGKGRESRDEREGRRYIRGLWRNWKRDSEEGSGDVSRTSFNRRFGLDVK